MTKLEPATHHIQQILQEILGLNDTENMSVSLERPLEEVDSARFNRARIEIDGHPYTVSVFVADTKFAEEDKPIRGSTAAEAAAGEIPGVKSRKLEDDQKPLTFTRDLRVSNPKLHQLYVGWARETIQATTALCQALWDQSRWPASDIAQSAWAKMREHIFSDAAWFEAAALEFVRDGDHVDSPRILVGDSLRGIPPGEYEGYITERGGKLYFEVSEDSPAKGD